MSKVIGYRSGSCARSVPVVCAAECGPVAARVWPLCSPNLAGIKLEVFIPTLLLSR